METTADEMPNAWKPWVGETDGPPHGSKTLAKLATALSKAQATMAGAVRDSVNPHFRSKYADLASVWDACRKPLTENGFCVLQPTSATGSIVRVTTMLLHNSGEYLSETLAIKAVSDTPQAIGSAITYGRRYGLAAMVGVAPEDDDGEAAHGRTGHAAAQAAPPETVLDTSTGAEVPASERPDAPAGYHYIDSYQLRNGWHEFVIRDFDAQGGAMTFSTKLKIGELAGQAFQQGVPVAVQWKPKPNKHGEAYCDRVTVWKPEPVGEMVPLDSMPF